MNQRNAALAVGRNFTGFFQFAVVALMLAVFSGTALADHKINVNKANAAMLDEVPGIGPVKAAAIIQQREKVGGFKSLDDLLQVSGIAEPTLIKIKPHLVLGNELSMNPGSNNGMTVCS